MSRARVGSYQEQEIKKRKDAKLIKKNPEKISDDDYIRLLDIMEDKLKKLKYVGNTIFNYISNNIKNNGKVEICKKEVSSNCILEYTRTSDCIIINKNSFDLEWDFTGFFGRNLHNIKLVSSYYSYRKPSDEYFELFEFLLNFKNKFDNAFILFTEGARIYKRIQTKIKKENINQLIENVDEVLALYYVNPRVDSATASVLTNVVKFSSTSSGFYESKYYKPIFEKLATPKDKNYAYLKGELILKIGEFKYKIETSITKNLINSECNISLIIFKWLEPTGWTILHHNSSINSLFKNKKNNLIQKDEFGHLEYDEMIKYAINFINRFEDSQIIGFNDFKVNFIKNDKYLI